MTGLSVHPPAERTLVMLGVDRPVDFSVGEELLSLDAQLAAEIKLLDADVHDSRHRSFLVKLGEQLRRLAERVDADERDAILRSAR